MFAYLVPYWRRLALVLSISVISTATSLAIPYLSKDLIDTALVGRDLAGAAAYRAWFAAFGVLGFVLNVDSGLRYTRVSAEILFDMRLALYEHLQRLSPRFYARTRLGDIVARLNNDISEIQRVAAEAALAWVGNVLFLAGSLVMMVWLDWRLSLVALAAMPVSLWALVHYRRRLEHRVADLRQRSADIGSFLIETLQAATLVVSSNAQARESGRFRRLNDAFIQALMAMQRVTYFAGGLPGVLLSIGSALVFLYGGSRVVDGTLTLGTFGAFLAYQMRVFAPAQALMGLYASLATARVSWRRVVELLDARVDVVESADACPLTESRGDVRFDRVTLTNRPRAVRSRRMSVQRQRRRVAGHRRRERRRQIHDRLSRCALARSGQRQRFARRPRSAQRSGSPTCGGTSCWSSRSRCSSTPRSARTFDTCGPRPTSRHCGRPRRPPASPGSSMLSRMASTRRSANAGWRCR